MTSQKIKLQNYWSSWDFTFKMYNNSWKLFYILCCDFELFSSSKHMASNWPGYIYRVRRCETAPSLPALWLGRKKQRFSGTNQKPELHRPFGTGPLRPCPQRLFFAFLTFLCPNFSCPFRLLPDPTNCPWVSEDESPRMSLTKHERRADL